MNFKETLDKTWRFIWDEDSIWSWLANIVLAFILIKFIVYPGLGFILGTQFPIVAVVSGSMEHEQRTFQDWWNTPCCASQQCTTKNNHEDIYKKQDITKEKFETFPYTSGFNKGDIMILRSATNLKQGNVIVFMTEGRNDPIIHRLVKIMTNNGQTIYTTEGDNNCGAIADFEKNIQQKQLIGKAYFKIPLLGWIKIFFVDLLQLMKVI
ncbi:signal peptidase I [Candidatus Woesearchaeota archaeon]|nr:signal peptidase I [Candidatus Woesearchaeota archaeon]